MAGKTRNKSMVEVKDCDKLNYLEHVQVHVTLSATKRGDVQINLISPSGTKSTLIDNRIKDYSRSGFNDWPFLSVRNMCFFKQKKKINVIKSMGIVNKVHMWEESPIGTWILEVVNDGRSVVELKNWRLVLWGTELPPNPLANFSYITGKSGATESQDDLESPIVLPVDQVVLKIDMFNWTYCKFFTNEDLPKLVK